MIISFKAEVEIKKGWEWTAIGITGFSLLLALITFGVLWPEAHKRVKPLKEKADDLERRAEAQSR